MYIEYFESFIEKDIQKFFGLVKTDFGDGDFGNLIRVEFYSNKIIGNIDFWSSGWLEIDLYKIHNKDLVQIYHRLFKPDECNNDILYICKDMIIDEYNK